MLTCGIKWRLTQLTVLWALLMFSLVCASVSSVQKFLDYGDSCGLNIWDREVCEEDKGVFCIGGTCSCRGHEVFQEVCRSTRSRPKQCWKQCVGTPNGLCTDNASPESHDRKFKLCVKNAVCIERTHKRTSFQVCACKHGFKALESECVSEKSIDSLSREGSTSGGSSRSRFVELKQNKSVSMDNIVGLSCSALDHNGFVMLIFMVILMLLW